VAESELTSAQQSQKQAALSAKDAMFEALLGKLTEVLPASGPAAAISVCRDQAPRIAAEIGQARGVTIGRTSFHLRNPENRPPEWAATLVAQRQDQPAFIPLPDGRLGALLPIRLKTTCLICHGPKDQIAPSVLSALAEHYPEDQATGFQEGDLRGWFWVEVPAGAGADTTIPPATETDSEDG
jgi:hypothetical protein